MSMSTEWLFIVPLGIIALYLAAVSLAGRSHHNAGGTLARGGAGHSLDSFTGPWV